MLKQINIKYIDLIYDYFYFKLLLFEWCPWTWRPLAS